MNKNRLRRTMMFAPGNNPSMIQDAHIYGADSIMMDLEDSVALAQKDAARLLVYNALKSCNYGNTELVVRVNPLSTPYGMQDIEAVVRAGVHVVRMPKTETAQDVVECDEQITRVERECGREVGSTLIMAAIESALGVVNAYAIATASPRMMGIALGAEDYSANLKTNRSKEGIELLLARQTIVVAARAAGIDALDTVFSDLNDMEGFANEIKLIKQLGFDGKSVINPRQIPIVHNIFAPESQQIEKSLNIIRAMQEATAKGSGVISLKGKMIDRPVLLRAQRTIDLAIASGIISKDELYGYEVENNG
ncbi:MAG: citrate (pro-3S)-lyase subunit beta [Clostridia bacterium]|nr:citrate (pro-3S)-lyase subunit beta [Clostridia bacterium]